MSAFPCDQGSHQWRIIADLPDVEGVCCEWCGFVQVRDKETGQLTGSVRLDQYFKLSVEDRKMFRVWWERRKR